MNRLASDVRPTLLSSLATAFLAGLIAGLVFLVIGLFRHGADLLLIAPRTSFAVWVLLKSVGLYSLLFGVVGLLLGLPVHLIGSMFGRGGRLVFATVLALLVSASVFVYLSSWWQLQVLAGLPFQDPERVNGALRHGLMSLGIGGGIVLLGVVIERLRTGRVPAAVIRRRAVAGAVVSLVCCGVSQLGLRTGDPGVDGAFRPSQVVVVGLDAMTFRIMAPLLRAGELPTFRRLIEEGAWGSFLTYGQASSPMVWTSMATGKRVRDHGINDFVTKNDSGYGVQPIKSFDRRSRAIWNVLSDFDRRVAVVDWLITYPPEQVNGYIVSRLHLDETNRTYPPELNQEIDAILANVHDYGDEARTRNFSRIDHVFEVAQLLLDKEQIDMLALFEGVSDWVEHRYWKYYEPDLFDGDLWDYDADDVAAVRTMIPETYAHIDRRLGELLAQLDDDALVMVVSDHGQKAVAGRQVWVESNLMLKALGCTELLDEADPKSVDRATSRAYAATETPWAPLIGVNLNVAGREPEGIVAAAEVEALTRDLVMRLQEIRFTDGTPVFGAIYATGEADGKPTDGSTTVAAQSDIVITHSRYTRSDRYSQETILVDGKEYLLDDFMEADTKISGGHDHQGVIFLHGKGVRPGPIGQQVVSTAMQEMIWHLTDKIELVDRFLPVLGRLGFIERATTLDVTPTILHAFGLPVGEDMSGRALTGLFETGQALETVATYETEDDGSIRAVDGQSDEEMMKRLKALGYVN